VYNRMSVEADGEKLIGRKLRRPAAEAKGAEVLPAGEVLDAKAVQKLAKSRIAAVDIVPWVSTEVEYLSADEEDMLGIAQYYAAKDSGEMIIADVAGTVVDVAHPKDLKALHATPVFEIVVKPDGGGAERHYPLQKFARSNQGTCLNHRAKVKPGQHVEKGDILADGPAIDDGEMALGRNVLVAFMPWEG